MERFSRDIILLERLAAGGMAEVFRAKHLGFGGFEKTVAIKRILPSFANNDEFKEMFRQEANLSAQLQHPNIVQIFSNGESSGYLYLEMEFVNGKNVRQMISRAEKIKNKIPIEVACYIVAEAAKGLEYAHHFHDEKTGEQLNIIHRDMSPQNIMLGYDGTVKIVDFGIAKAAARGEGTKAGVLKGKFGYMSPEQAQGMKLDSRTDIFSMGIILWELLTQKRLFSTDDDLQTLQLVRECNVIKPSKKNPVINYALDKIVMKALAKDKSERYATAGELYSDLIRYLNEKHPDFIPTKVAVYIKEIYSEIIEQEKKKREQINLQAPAVLAEQKISDQKADTPKNNQSHKDKTQIENDDKTQLSISRALPSDDRGLNLSENLDIKSMSEVNDVNSLSSSEAAATHSPIAMSAPNDGPMELSGHHDLSKLKIQTPNSAKGNFETTKKKKPINRLRLYAVAIILIVLVIGLNKKKAQSEAPSTAQVEATLNGEVAEVAEGNKIQNQEMPVVAENTPSLAEPSREPSAPADQVPDPNRMPAITENNAAPNSSPTNIVEQDVSTPTPMNLTKETISPSIDNKLEEREPSSIPGFVELRSTPRADEIYVDDKLMQDEKGKNQQTPAKNLKLKAGLRKLRLVNRAFGAYWEGSVEIRADRLVKKDVILVNKLSK